MPLYDFYNTETGETEEKFLPYSELHKFQKDNPHMQYRPTINIGDSVRMGTYTSKLPTEFREGILDKAKKAHPLGTIQT